MTRLPVVSGKEAVRMFERIGYQVVMRATEAVMYEYYVAVCQPQSQDKLDNWGAYLAKLRGEKQPDVEKVVAILQLIKDQDRNFIMHPEVVLSAEEAFVLFEVAQGAIIAMASRL